jgi:hypothetical protein
MRHLRARSAFVLGIGVLAGLPVPCSATFNTGNGAKASFVSVTNVALGTPIAPTVIQPRIKKALAGTVLTLEVSILATGGTADYEPYVLVFPNVCSMEPTLGAAVAQECPAGEECVLTMNYWCDIDAAEASNPGGVINSPIRIDVIVFDANSAPAGAHINLSAAARLESKN